MEELKMQLIECHTRSTKLAACKSIGKYFDISLKERKELCDKYWELDAVRCSENIIMDLQKAYKLKSDNDITQEGNEKTGAFLKEAFCIDEECIFVGFALNENAPFLSNIINIISSKSSMVYELNDSKRGKFYVTISK